VAGVTIVFFGAAEIALRTASKFGLPDLVVDNSPDMWGQSYGALVNVRNPDTIKDLAGDIRVVICSTSIREITEQLRGLGVQTDSVRVSPYVRSLASPLRLEAMRASFLVASGGPVSDSESGGGGLYSVVVNGGEVSVSKILSRSCHSIRRKPQGGFLVSTDRGVTELSDSLVEVGSIRLPAGIRPHGIAFDKRGDKVYVVGSHVDMVLEFSISGELVGEIDIAFERTKNHVPRHHANDVEVVDGEIYVSMFSVSGSWRKGNHDGGVVSFSRKSGQRLGTVVSNLTMPHSVLVEDEELFVLSSGEGLLLGGSRNTLAQLPTFARGLDVKDGYFIIGASRNRNPDDRSRGDVLVKEVSNGFNVIDRQTLDARMVQLGRNIPEIHACILTSAVE